MWSKYLSFGVLSFHLVACGGSLITEELAPSDTIIYQAQEIANRQIQFVWIEVPSNLSLGDNEIRVFMARTDPLGMLVPTEPELPCMIESANDYLDLRPVALPFEFDGEQLVGSYTWRACASCVDCYLDWETTMEINATMEPDKMTLAIGIRHMGHNIQDDYLRIDLYPEKPNSQEPSIQCRRSFDCKEIKFVQRP